MYYLYNEDFNNYLDHPEIPLHSAKLILTDIPYNIGRNAYASNPQWWTNGNIKDGYSNKANSELFTNENDLVVDPCFGSGVVYKEAKKAIDVL